MSTPVRLCGSAVETGVAEGMLAAHAMTTIHYLIRKEMGNARSARTVSAILRVFRVAAVDGVVIQQALELPVSDFEDAVTASRLPWRMNRAAR